MIPTFLELPFPALFPPASRPLFCRAPALLRPLLLMLQEGEKERSMKLDWELG